MCLQTYAHTIVHSSAMLYQNLIIIHECSNKLLEKRENLTQYLQFYKNFIGYP